MCFAACKLEDVRYPLIFFPRIFLHVLNRQSLMSLTAFHLRIVSNLLLFDQLLQKAQIKLENEIACISLNPTSNQPVTDSESDAAAMDSDEGKQEQLLDSLVAVGTWTDMTVRRKGESSSRSRLVIFSTTGKIRA